MGKIVDLHGFTFGKGYLLCMVITLRFDKNMILAEFCPIPLAWLYIC